MVSNFSLLSIEEVTSPSASPAQPVKSETDKKTEAAVNVPLQNLQEQKTLESLDHKVISLQKERDALIHKRMVVAYKVMVVGVTQSKLYISESDLENATQQFLQSYEEKSVHHGTLDPMDKDQVDSLERQCAVLKKDISFFEEVLKNS